MPVRAQWALFIGQRLRNFGFKSSQRDESLHAELKRLLRRRRVNLEELHQKIREMVARQQERYTVKLDIELRTTWPRILAEHALAPLAYRISRKALKLLMGQYDMVLAAWKAAATNKPNWEVGIRSSDCTNAFEAQMGLPCKHVMFEKLSQDKNTQFTRSYCDQFWSLDSATVSFSSDLFTYASYLYIYGNRTIPPPPPLKQRNLTPVLFNKGVWLQWQEWLDQAESCQLGSLRKPMHGRRRKLLEQHRKPRTRLLN